MTSPDLVFLPLAPFVLCLPCPRLWMARWHHWTTTTLHRTMGQSWVSLPARPSAPTNQKPANTPGVLSPVVSFESWGIKPDSTLVFEIEVLSIE